MSQTLPQISLHSIVADKRVVLDRPWTDLIECVVAAGARGVLSLAQSSEKQKQRYPQLASAPFRRSKDISCNNCEVAIIRGASSPLLSKKYKFQNFQRVLLPCEPWAFGASWGLLRYMPRGDIQIIGRTAVPNGKRLKWYLVLAIKDRQREIRRQYAPIGKTPKEIVQSISDLDLVLLRNEAEIASGKHAGDLDILISAKDVDALKQRFNAGVGTYPIDVYTDDGSLGHSHFSAPYYAPHVAKKILASATVTGDGIKVPAPYWQFVSYCYHLLFHAKLVRGANDTGALSTDAFTSGSAFNKLKEYAALAGREAPRTIDDLEKILHEADAMPSLDLIGFYSAQSPLLKERFIDSAKVPPGLITVFLRDFGRGTQDVPALRDKLRERFVILAEGAVLETNAADIRRGVRGGNWTDKTAPTGVAEAVYWFVCWDERPKPPSWRVKRKYPRLDNENIRVKDMLRLFLGSDGKSVRGTVHTSDNTIEALDHLRCLGLEHSAPLINFLESKRVISG